MVAGLTGRLDRRDRLGEAVGLVGAVHLLDPVIQADRLAHEVSHTVLQAQGAPD